MTGEEGEEIDCDDHGRILVHFYWDRHGDKSCRVRVTQVWGGQGWGGQVIPRIGMEVMVAFIDGDPDRPIVVGCVPNPQTLTVPYELPAKKTKMAWRSKTHKGLGLQRADVRGRQRRPEPLHARREGPHPEDAQQPHPPRRRQLDPVDRGQPFAADRRQHEPPGRRRRHQIIGLPPASNAAVDAAPASLLNTDSGAGMAAGAATWRRA